MLLFNMSNMSKNNILNNMSLIKGDTDYSCVVSHICSAEGKSLQIPFAPISFASCHSSTEFNAPLVDPNMITETPLIFIADSKSWDKKHGKFGMISALSRNGSKCRHPTWYNAKASHARLAQKKSGISVPKKSKQS